MAGVLIVLLGCFVASSSAQKESEWKRCLDALTCLGTVRMRVTGPFSDGPVGAFAVSYFSNGDVLLEDLSGARPRKLLRFVNESVSLFHGVNGVEDAESLRYTYQRRTGKAFLAVFILLATGFPEGPRGISESWALRKVDMQGEQFQISAKKTASDAFIFRAEGPHWHADGEWGMTRPSPWPDSHPMAGWTGEDGRPVPPTLGEVRKSVRR